MAGARAPCVFQVLPRLDAPNSLDAFLPVAVMFLSILLVIISTIRRALEQDAAKGAIVPSSTAISGVPPRRRIGGQERKRLRKAAAAAADHSRPVVVVTKGTVEAEAKTEEDESEVPVAAVELAIGSAEAEEEVDTRPPTADSDADEDETIAVAAFRRAAARLAAPEVEADEASKASTDAANVSDDTTAAPSSDAEDLDAREDFVQAEVDVHTAVSAAAEECAAVASCSCADDLAWGCPLHRTYSLGLLLMHRSMREGITARGPPGLCLPVGAASSAL